MKHWTNIAFWVLGAVSLIFAIWTIVSLAGIYSELHETRAEIGRKNDELAERDNKIAASQSTLATTQQALEQERQRLASLTTDLQQLNSQLESLQKTNQSICPQLQQMTDTQRRILGSSTAALLNLREDICGKARTILDQNATETKRAASLASAVEARLRGDFATANPAYAAALAIPGGAPADRAKIQTDAQINLVKSMCAGNQSPLSVAVAYAQMVGNAAASPTGKCSIATDAELYRVCAYARITPERNLTCPKTAP